MTLLIGKYHVRNYSPTGRGTKGYFAFAVGKARLLFLKVSWRPETDEVTPEVDRYAELYEHNVPHIAQLVGGGDTKHDPREAQTPVGKTAKRRTRTPGDNLKTAKLRTRTQDLLNIPKLHARIQTRLIFETLGIPLSEYHESVSLVKVIRDAIEGEQRDGSSIQNTL